MKKYILIALILMMAANLNAVELTGKLSSELYLYEKNGSSHARIYERLRTNITLWKSPHYRSLDFHTYLRFSTDLMKALTEVLV